ncbi:hypothetical protein HPP92_018904 [Vanilla planifolia]|uniref:Uncharacterized protein n=1 Tax=Vanilla planifolia TaxID=51239 RepID=A0A835UL67_VANPL|nr:hypothetical protein HPP92_018904 [Vanilla planifolia]
MATSILTGENSLGKGMKDSSSAVSDPRQPSSAKPYIPPPISPQDLPVDYAGFLAVALGVTGVMFRVCHHGIGYKLLRPKTSIHCSTLMLTPKTFSWEHYHLLSSFKIKP